MASVPDNADGMVFEALTPLGFSVRVMRRRCELIVTAKHPVMAGRENTVKVTLEKPDEIRQSRTDAQVLLFYKAEATRRWTCAVVKQLPEKGFLITAYPTDAIKEGVRSMAEVKVFHDREGQTLTVWFTDPSQEDVCEEIGDEVVLMKDRSGRVIGFEKLNFSVPESDDLRVALETAPA